MIFGYISHVRAEIGRTMFTVKTLLITGSR